MISAGSYSACVNSKDELTVWGAGEGQAPIKVQLDHSGSISHIQMTSSTLVCASEGKIWTVEVSKRGHIKTTRTEGRHSEIVGVGRGFWIAKVKGLTGQSVHLWYETGGS